MKRLILKSKDIRWSECLVGIENGKITQVCDWTEDIFGINFEALKGLEFENSTRDNALVTHAFETIETEKGFDNMPVMINRKIEEIREAGMPEVAKFMECNKQIIMMVSYTDSDEEVCTPTFVDGDEKIVEIRFGQNDLYFDIQLREMAGVMYVRYIDWQAHGELHKSDGWMPEYNVYDYSDWARNLIDC